MSRYTSVKRFLAFLIVLSIFHCSSSGQTSVGIQPYGTYSNGFDDINVGTLDVHFEIPLFVHQGRGIGNDIGAILVYDGGSLGLGGYIGGSYRTNAGWTLKRGALQAGTINVLATNVSQGCPGNNSPNPVPAVGYTYSYSDKTGYPHNFSGNSYYNPCDGSTNPPANLPLLASDGSGYLLTQASGFDAIVVDPSGKQIQNLGLNVDSNGNTTARNNIDSSILTISGDFLPDNDPDKSSSLPPIATSYFQYHDANGSSQSTIVTYKRYPIVPITYDNATYYLYFIDSITFADNSAYHFSYEESSSYAGKYTGRVASITVPTGGVISYQYIDTAIISNHPQTLTTLSRTTSDGSSVYNRTITSVANYAIASSNTTVSESGRTTLYTFVTPFGAYETSKSVFLGSTTTGTPIQKITHCYNGATGDCTTQAINLPVTQISESLSYDGGAPAKRVQTMNSMGLQTELDEYDFGASSPTRKTVIQYAALGNNISDRPQSITIKDANNQTVSQISYGYDESSLIGTSGVSDHGSVNGARGNRTSKHVWLNTGGTLDTHWQYDDAGQVRGAQDIKGNWTTFGYDSATDSCLTSTIYPVQANGSNLAESSTCDPYTGLRSTSTNLNGVLTTYTYDAMMRPTGSIVTAGSNLAAKTTIAYGFNGSHQTVTTTETATPNPDLVTVKTLDGYGRTLSETLANGAHIDTTYDALGRTHSVSNPYFSTSEQTYGITTYGYDALNRMTSRQLPSTASAHLYSYSNNYVTETDEQQSQWIRKYDIWQQVKQVTEPGGLNTAYSYDLLGNLLTTAQDGGSSNSSLWRTRTFAYDSASRLLSATNPETGTISYSYLSNGSSCAGDPTLPCSKTDARGVVTTYNYDALNRLKSKTYSDGTLPAVFGYDGNNENGIPLLNFGIQTSNAIGRLSLTSNQTNNGQAFAYDAMGHVAKQSNLLPDTASYNVYTSATYDLAGNMISITYPDGRNVSQGFDSAGRISSVGYASWNGNGKSYSYLSNPSYSPAGSLTGATMGNGIGMAASYDNRQRIGMLAYGTSAQLLWGKGYQWTANGNLQSITDAFSGSQRQFGYDNLNRLKSAQDIAGSATGTNTTPYSVGSGTTTPSTTVSSTSSSLLWTDPDDSNLLVNPDVPGASGWGIGNASLTNNLLAPDGTMTATSFTANTGSVDSFLLNVTSNQYLYDNETMTASVWLKVPGGSQTVNLYLVESGSAGHYLPASKAVTVTTTWQQFQLSGSYHSGYDGIMFQVGGGGSVTSGQTVQLWGMKLEDTGTSGRTVTNFAHYSQRVGGGHWGIQAGSLVENAGTAPDGTNTAATVTANSGSNDSWIVNDLPNPAPFSGLTVTGSVWLRSLSGTQNISITLINVGANGWSAFGGGTVTVTSDWQRFQMSGINQGVLSTLELQVGGAGTFAHGQTIQLWGVQMELASSAGPYVATGDAPASIGTNLTNLLPYSQQPNGTSWLPIAVNSAVNAVQAPDGTMTGYEMSAVSGASDAWITDDLQHPSLYNASMVTGSVFLRTPSGATSINISLFGENASGRTYLGSQLVQLTPNWRRFSMTGQLPNGLYRVAIQIGGAGTFASGKVVDLWGAQLELGPTTGPYVATSALPVTAGQELTNLLLNSQQVSGPGWGIANGSLSSNSATAPDGTSTAATVTANSGSTDSYAIANVPNPSLYDSQTVTGSVYLRAPNGTSNINLYLVNVGENGWSNPVYIPITVTTSWQRFSVTGTNQNGLTALSLQIAGGGTLTSGQSIQIWGAQMVIGTAAAPYTPTTTTTTNIVTSQPGTLVQNGLNQSYAYDSFGNILQNGSFNSTYTAKNQMFGYGYDAAGNLLSNGLVAMTWDAENRISTVGGATYIYDAEGNRVSKQGVGVTDTVYFGGRPIARYSAGQWTDLIYGPNGLIAEVPGTESAEPSYRLLDHLGTEVGVVGNNQILTNPLDYSPFGQIISGNTGDPYLFTGKERDTESGLDDFGARYFGSTMGRFLSPDPVGGSLLSPQSLNRYAYVLNNPLRNTDPTGLDCVYKGDSAANSTVVSGDCLNDDDAGVFVDAHVDSLFDKGGNIWANVSAYTDQNNPYGGTGTPSVDPQDARIQQLAQGINQGAGALNNPSTYFAWYGASLAGAVGVLSAPAVISSGVNASGLLGGSARVFFSGAGAAGASAYAAANNAVTLTMTPLGRFADYLNGENGVFSSIQNGLTYAAWAQLSTWFAEGAEGTATYFEGPGGYQGSVWFNYEMPTLVQRGIPIVTVPHP